MSKPAQLMSRQGGRQSIATEPIGPALMGSGQCFGAVDIASPDHQARLLQFFQLFTPSANVTFEVTEAVWQQANAIGSSAVAVQIGSYIG